MQTQNTKLKNGLSVIFVDTDSFPTMTMMVLVGAGSRHESEENSGISHFIEHMAFKGSKKYPTSYDIASKIDGLGGECNAFTSKDHTGYYVKAPKRCFEDVSDILSDMLASPRLLPKEIEKEKNVIVEEINMYEDMPARSVSNVFDELIYAGHPLGRDIAGTPKTVRSFTKKTFTDYLSKHYNSSNVTVVVAGGLKMSSPSTSSSGLNRGSMDSRSGSGMTGIDIYQSIIEEKFGKWNGRTENKLNRFSHNQNKPQISIKTKKVEQTHVCVGYRAFAFTDPRRYALTVLSGVLGGGMSSRLFMEVRERRGLCYYISTGRDLYQDTGYIVTQAGVSTDVKKVNEAIRVIRDEHEKIATGHIEAKDIIRAKSMMKGRFLLSLEDSHTVASLYGTRQLLYGSTVDPQDIVKAIDAVTKEEVISLASDIFVDEGLNIAAIGPMGEDDIGI
ncbi:MAG: pitrilysin family protein [Candidatus Roizmanbacteria bacterium]|nr:pitrilysin family protein [Candidatus Roizmanbacteria bacterium]